MTPIEYKTLEDRVEKIEGKLDDQLDVLAKINEKLKKLDTIEVGLFGNDKIGYSGVIKTQASLQVQVTDLDKEIAEIKKINADQDIRIGAKKTVWIMVLEIVKWVAVAYMVAKGVFGPESLLGKIF